MSDEEFRSCLDPNSPWITEADLTRLGVLPVPDWARKPPKPKERGLFDFEDDAEESGG